MIGVWSFLSWRYLGSVIPDTYFIKREQAAWFNFTFADGILLYYIKYRTATLISLALLPLVPLSLLLARNNKIWRAFVVMTAAPP